MILVNIIITKIIKNVINLSTDDSFRATIDTGWIYDFIFNLLTDILKIVIETKLSEITKNGTTLFKIVMDHSEEETRVAIIRLKKSIIYESQDLRLR